MKNELFRREALLHSASSKFGESIFYQPLSLRVMVLSVVFVFLFFVTFAAFAELKQSERVRGVLAFREGEVKLYASRPGVVSELHVSDGDIVAAGDVLATMVTAGTDETGNRIIDGLLSNLELQIDRHHTLLEVLEQREAAETARLQRRIEVLAQEKRLVLDEHQMLVLRLEIAEQDFLTNRKLYETSAISKREYNQARSTWYGLQQQSKASLLAAQLREGAITDAREQQNLLPISFKEERLALESNLLQLRQRSDELRTQGRFSITAPVAGRITNLITTTGDLLEPRSPFVTVSPLDNTLEARLYLPSRSRGDIMPEQLVMLSYDAFPYQTHGSFQAEINTIAAVVLDPREHLIPLELNEPVYLARARLMQQTVGEPGSGAQLRSGMQFTADIVTGRETILQRVMSPLSGLGRKL